MVAFFAHTRRDLATRALANLEREPDPAWVGRIAGRYTNPSLGDLRIALEGRSGTFDVGEWKSAFARRREEDGSSKLILIDPPFAGGETIVGADQAHPTLTIDDGQIRYVFERSP